MAFAKRRKFSAAYFGVRFSGVKNDKARRMGSNYIEVSQWEGENEESGGYGRGVYSLRSYSDVVQFCNILLSSSNIRARRRSD